MIIGTVIISLLVLPKHSKFYTLIQCSCRCYHFLCTQSSSQIDRKLLSNRKPLSVCPAGLCLVYYYLNWHSLQLWHSLAWWWLAYLISFPTFLCKMQCCHLRTPKWCQVSPRRPARQKDFWKLVSRDEMLLGIYLWFDLTPLGTSVFLPAILLRLCFYPKLPQCLSWSSDGYSYTKPGFGSTR